MKGKKIAIFIPAFNEERSIGSVVLGAKKYGRVFVIDDGSKDRTAEIAKAAGAEVIPRQSNGGYGAALKTALSSAKKTSADAFVFLDADFQHDPDEILVVAAPVLQGRADVCLGSRFLGRTIGAPEYRTAGVRALNHLSKIHAEKTGAQNGSLDFQCGFRAFSKKVIGNVDVEENGYEACAEIIVSALRAGLKVAEVPVTIRYYGEGNGKNPMVHGAGLLGYVVNAIAKKKPLVVFGLGGVLLLAISALLGIFVVRTFYGTGVLALGSALLTVFAGIAGFVLILIGINLYTLQALLERREK